MGLKFLGFAGVITVLLLTFPLSASAQYRSFHGRSVANVGWGWGGPGWGWDWGYYGAPYYPPTTGSIKLKDVDKNDEVFVNGAFAGRAKHADSMQLAPGTYHVVVKKGNREVLNRSVYVTLSKTVKLYVGDKPED
jgi:hypothetical protein